MATEIEALMLRMEVNLRGYERQLARARQTTDEAMKRVETTTRDTARRVEKSMEGISFGGLAAGASRAAAALGPLGGALSGLVSAEALRRAIDGYTRTINALKVAGLEGENLRQTYEELFDIANRQGAPIEELSRLFGQLTQAQRDLGVSSQTIKTLVEATGQALRVSGVPASQAAGAILGLSQSLSGGTVRAEEFNQMLEGGLRPALQAAANGLREAEGSVGKLRQIIVEGELSSKDFARAIEAGQQGLAELASRADETSAQALNRLNNALFDAAGNAKVVPATSTSSARVMVRETGTRSVTTVPTPSRDSNSSWPPRARTRVFTTSTPTPRPDTCVTSRAVEKPGWAITDSSAPSSSASASATTNPNPCARRSTSARSMPRPSSCT